jgi:hypothetical protein
MEQRGPWERLTPLKGVVVVALILGAGVAFAVTSGGAATAEFCQAHPKWAKRHPNKCPTTTTTTSTSSSTTTSSTTTSTTTTTTTTSGGCDLSASPSNFTTQLNAVAAGQTVCLATGNYGTFAGTNKAVTIKAAQGAAPTMKVSLGSGDSGFTLDGIQGMGGTVTAGARDITIRNSAFTSWLDFQSGPTPNFVLDHDTFININSPQGTPNARVGLHYGGSTASGVTLKNSLLQGGDSDGVHTGVGLNVLNNEFANICPTASSYNHTDAMQYEGSVGGVVRGNYFHDNCNGQMLTSYDGGTQGVLIEDNVLDTLRPAALEFYSDNGSIIRHNTLVWHPPSECAYSQNCGQIDLNRKSADPAGTGTQVYDNVTYGVGTNNGSTAARIDHNVSGSQVTYAGGASPTTYQGFHLAPGSVGKGAASDGADVGIR